MTSSLPPQPRCLCAPWVRAGVAGDRAWLVCTGWTILSTDYLSPYLQSSACGGHSHGAQMSSCTCPLCEVCAHTSSSDFFVTSLAITFLPSPDPPARPRATMAYNYRSPSRQVHRLQLCPLAEFAVTTALQVCPRRGCSCPLWVVAACATEPPVNHTDNPTPGRSGSTVTLSPQGAPIPEQDRRRCRSAAVSFHFQARRPGGSTQLRGESLAGSQRHGSQNGGRLDNIRLCWLSLLPCFTLPSASPPLGPLPKGNHLPASPSLRRCFCRELRVKHF